MLGKLGPGGLRSGIDDSPKTRATHRQKCSLGERHHLNPASSLSPVAASGATS
jgi:hypothetical protein